MKKILGLQAPTELTSLTTHSVASICALMSGNRELTFKDMANMILMQAYQTVNIKLMMVQPMACPWWQGGRNGICMRM